MYSIRTLMGEYTKFAIIDILKDGLHFGWY